MEYFQGRVRIVCTYVRCGEGREEEDDDDDDDGKSSGYISPFLEHSSEGRRER